MALGKMHAEKINLQALRNAKHDIISKKQTKQIINDKKVQLSKFLVHFDNIQRVNSENLKFKSIEA